MERFRVGENIETLNLKYINYLSTKFGIEQEFPVAIDYAKIKIDLAHTVQPPIDINRDLSGKQTSKRIWSSVYPMEHKHEDSTGKKHKWQKKVSEDAVLPSKGLYEIDLEKTPITAVFDGVSKSKGEASHVYCLLFAKFINQIPFSDFVEKYYKSQRVDQSTLSSQEKQIQLVELGKWYIQKMVKYANQFLTEKAKSSIEGLSTTLLLNLVVGSENLIANLGDSLAFYFNRNTKKVSLANTPDNGFIHGFIENSDTIDYQTQKEILREILDILYVYSDRYEAYAKYTQLVPRFSQKLRTWLSLNLEIDFNDTEAEQFKNLLKNIRKVSNSVHSTLSPNHHQAIDFTVVPSKHGLLLISDGLENVLPQSNIQRFIEDQDGRVLLDSLERTAKDSRNTSKFKPDDGSAVLIYPEGDVCEMPYYYHALQNTRIVNQEFKDSK